MELDFDIKMSAPVLFDYFMRHTYTGTQGLVGLGIGIAVLVYGIYMQNPIYMGAAAVILLYLPFTLFLRAIGQCNTNPAFKAPIHYHMDETGVVVSQNGTSQSLRWELVQKAVATGTSIIIYTSPVNAWIFPKKELGEKTDDLIRLIVKCMPEEKVRFKHNVQ